MATPIVFDSSALLAITFNETGGDVAKASLSKGVLSAVNASEVVARFVDLGADRMQAQAWLRTFDLPIRPFDEALAIETGLLRASVKRIGLSLGDRACIALARREGGSVITADQNWTRLKLGVEVLLIR